MGAFSFPVKAGSCEETHSKNFISMTAMELSVNPAVSIYDVASEVWKPELAWLPRQL